MIFHPPPHVSVHLAGSTAPRQARRVVKGLLVRAEKVEWHDNAELVVSEIVANAIAACGACDLSAWYLESDRALRVEVTDTSPALPVPQPVSSTRVGGHGLRIVERLSSRWGVIQQPGSKTVWFEVDG